MIVQPGIENASMIRRIGESIKHKNISHAYVVEGPACLDKPAFAENFAKAILCPDGRGENCGACPICSKIDHSNHEDLVYLRKPSNKASLGIDLVRDMQRRIAIKPNGLRYIVIIEDSDLMTEEAQNCLLKTLEEPPGNTVLILLTENWERLLPTIRSRCIRLRIEMTAEAADEELRRQAESLLQGLMEGKPFYWIRKTLGDTRDRQKALMLIDCMEQQCRRMILPGNNGGIPVSPEEIGRYVEALEKARQSLARGLSAPYVMKKTLLSIGG